MPKFKHFELQEFIKSETATKKKIDNTPTFEIVEHLADLTEQILEPLRAAYGKPIIVSSGYRCEKLNQAVVGVTNSVHQLGYAADLQAADMAGFKKFVRDWMNERRVRFDQCIIEHDAKGKQEWIHIGLYSPTGLQRRMLFQLEVNK